MARFTRDEIQQAFDHYQKVSAHSASTGDWRGWADLFTEDATYIEHLFGEYQGREAIYQWITETMRKPPNSEMNAFPVQWHVIDEDKGWVICAVANRMKDPGDGSIHEAVNWTILTYAGDNLWSSEEDMYNPMEFGEMIKGYARRKSELSGGASTT